MLTWIRFQLYINECLFYRKMFWRLLWTLLFYHSKLLLVVYILSSFWALQCNQLLTFFSLVERASSVIHQQQPTKVWFTCYILSLYPCTLNQQTRFRLFCLKQLWVSGKFFWTVCILCKDSSIEGSAKLFLEIYRSLFSNFLCFRMLHYLSCKVYPNA